MTYILHHVNHESSAALSVHPDVESAIHAVGDRVAAYDEWDDRIHVDEGKDQDIAGYEGGESTLVDQNLDGRGRSCAEADYKGTTSRARSG